MVFGVTEEHGLPTNITGVQTGDIDLELRRLESILASGLEPRIRYTARVVSCSGGQRVLIIRAERSWWGPHRIIFKGNDKFYGRNAIGKYPLDVNELRVAFTLASTVTERIRAFRVDRIIALSNNETPVPFEKAAKIALHCIPLESFAAQPQYDLVTFYKKDATSCFWPLPRSGWSYRFNLDGLIALDGTDDRPSTSYTQLYRNGVIEAVSVVAHEYQGRLTIPSVSYEKRILHFLPICFQMLMRIGAGVPLIVALALTNTRDLHLGVDVWRFGGGHQIREDSVVAPERVVEDFSEPPGKILKPMFDIVWNACGYSASQNFDAQGTWVERG